MIAVLGIFRTGGDVLLIFLFTPGLMATHYTIEYRTHFTNFHQIVIGGFGVTE